MSKIPVRTIVYLGILTALEIVLNRFLSLNAWNLKIGFSFVPVALAGLLFGPLGGGIVGALGDLLGAVLFPIGPYFPGFTLTAFITAFGYGFCLQKKQHLPLIVTAVLFSENVVTLLLNTKWISILYGTPFIPVLIPRIAQAVGMGIVEVIVIRLLANYVPHLKKAV